ncbi:MAG: CARDB domain-containing protein [Paracoccaceae bacterium]
MFRRKCTVIAVIAACSAATGMAIAQQTVAQQTADQATRHAVKLVCGVQPDPKNLQLVQGVYATTVNFLNIGPARRNVDLSLALAHPPVPPAPGDIVEIGALELGVGEAAAVDCADIEVLSFPFGLPDSYIDGFVVIDADGPLSVQAVYTAAPLLRDGCCKKWPGPVASIDVERFDPVPTAAGAEALPDLLPDSPTLETDPLGAPGTGFCGETQPGAGPPGAVAIIMNQGEIASPASLARFDFGAFGQSDSPAPALEPGESFRIDAPIPRRCFGSGRGGACAFDIVADAGAAIAESLETNNTRRGHCLRAAPR